jgi:hypothetical protein
VVQQAKQQNCAYHGMGRPAQHSSQGGKTTATQQQHSATVQCCAFHDLEQLRKVLSSFNDGVDGRAT